MTLPSDSVPVRKFAFDTETTGIGAASNRLTEIAIVEFDPDTGISFTEDPTRVFHTFINPEMEVPPEVVKVHGMTWDLLKAYPVFAEVAPLMIDFLTKNNGTLVAHNAKFDVGFINAELKRAKIKGYEKTKLEDLCVSIEDTLVISRANVISKKHKLDHLADRYGVDRTKRVLHDARGDCVLLAEVYPHLMSDVENNKSAVSKILPFPIGDESVDPEDVDTCVTRYLMLQTLVKILDKDANRYKEMVRDAVQGCETDLDEAVVEFSNRTTTDWDQITKDLLPSDFDPSPYQKQSSAMSIKFK